VRVTAVETAAATRQEVVSGYASGLYFTVR